MKSGFKNDNILNGDPLPWLLETDNPSVRFWTLVDILEQPLEDNQVKEARKAISSLPLVQDIFSRQKPAGNWGSDETKPFNADGTLCTLSILRVLGVEPDARTYTACQTFLRFGQSKNGGFSFVKCRPSGVYPCSTGENLPVLIYFNMAGDVAVNRAFNYLIDSMEEDDSLICSRYQGRECLWAAIATLKGLFALPQELQSEQTRQLVRRYADILLNANLDFSGEHRRWFTFGVPRAWDLLSALLILAHHGYSCDERFIPLLELVINKQDENGCWRCGSVSRTWQLERQNKPSKWVTLDALRLLKQAGKLI